MPLKILHAADASAAASELASLLRRERKRSATILLASEGLDGASNKNDIIREALAAANDNALLVVRLDDALPPVGTRDSPTVQWSPNANAANILATLRTVRSKSDKGRPLGCGVYALVALVVVGVLLVISLGGRYLYSPPEAYYAPDASTHEPVSLVEAIHGRWATSFDKCANAYLALSVDETGIRASDGNTYEVQRIDGDSFTIIARTRDGGHVLFRFGDGDDLTMTAERDGTSYRLIRCPPSETTTILDRLDELETSVHDIQGNLRTVEGAAEDLRESVRIIDERIVLLLGGLGLLLVLNAFMHFSVRSSRRRQSRPAAEPTDTSAGPMVVASYSRKDSELVDQVVRKIETDGVAIWMDKADIGAGTTWSEEIVRAIRNSRGLILFCSEHAFESDHVLRELNLADSCRKPVYPLLLEPVAVPDSFLYYLSTRQILDFKNDPDWEAKLAVALKPSVRQVAV